MQLSLSSWFFLVNILLLSCMGEAGLYPTTAACCFAWSPICISLTPITPRGYALKGRQREFNWDGAFLSLHVFVKLVKTTNAKVDDSKCSLEMLHVLLLGRPKRKDGGKNWTLFKPFYLPSSPACTFVRFVSSFLYLKWDPTPPPPRLNFIQEECQLSKYTRIIPSACMHTCITRLGYWISFGEKSILYHSFMDGDELTRRVQINWSPPAS